MNTIETVLCATALAVLWPAVAAAQDTRPAAKIQTAPPAKERTQDELKALRAEKLKKPVFQHAAWLRDYDEAREKAADEGKWLLVYFTRSYAP